MWSGPGVDKDEHLAIASLNSCFENGAIEFGQLVEFHLGKMCL